MIPLVATARARESSNLAVANPNQSSDALLGMIHEVHHCDGVKASVKVTLDSDNIHLRRHHMSEIRDRGSHSVASSRGAESAANSGRKTRCWRAATCPRKSDSHGPQEIRSILTTRWSNRTCWDHSHFRHFVARDASPSQQEKSPEYSCAYELTRSVMQARSRHLGFPFRSESVHDGL